MLTEFLHPAQTAEERSRIVERALRRRAHKDERRRKRGWHKLREEARCRLCLRARKVRPLTRHRLIPGREGGSYEYGNVVPLCRPCHDLVDGCTNRARKRDRQLWRAMLRRVLTDAEVHYVRRVMGDGWLRENYPTHARLPK